MASRDYHHLGRAAASMSDMRMMDDPYASRRHDLEETEKDLRIRVLQRDLETTQQLLQRERDRGDNPELHSELTRLREETRREAMRSEELKRELDHYRETQALQSSLKVTELQQELQSLQQELQTREQELRSREASLRMLQDQHSAELDRSKSRHEQQDRLLSDLRRDRDEANARLRQANTELEEKNRQLAQDLDAAQRQIERKDEYTRLLEDEARQQRARLEQSERMVAAQQSQVHDLEGQLQSLQLELDAKTRSLADMEGRSQTAEATAEEFQAKEERVRREYNEIGDLVGATELQKSACLVSRKVRDLLAEHSRSQLDRSEWEKRHEQWQFEGSNREMRVEQLERELAKAQELLRRREAEMASLQEELVQRTRELRVMTTSRETDQRDIRVREERLQQEYRLKEDRLLRDSQLKDEKIARLEDTMREKERQMLETSRQERHATELMSGERSRLESKHAHELSLLQSEIAQLRDDARSDRQFSQTCQTLGRLLNVDPDTTPSAYAEKLVRSTEALLREADELRSGRGLDGTMNGLGSLSLGGPLSGAHSAYHPGYAGTGPSSYGHSLQGYHRELSGSHVPYGVPVHHDGTPVTVPGLGATGRFDDHAPGQNPAQDVAWLKQQLREAEERWVKLRVQHDGFRRSVAKIVQISEGESDDEFLRNLKRAFKNHDRNGGPRSAASGRPGTSGGSKQLQRRLETALKTIESQDLWIELLNKKIDQQDKPSRGTSSGRNRNDLAQEVQRLQSQVHTLKQQLYAEQSQRMSPHTSMSMSGGFGDTLGLGGVGAGGSSNLSEKLQEMSARLEKHIQFRTEVMNIIGIRSITCPDSEILHQLRFLKSEVERLQRIENGYQALPPSTPLMGSTHY